MFPRTRTSILALAGLALAWTLPCPRAWAKPLALFDEEKENAELLTAREELKELERKIKRRDIPSIEFEFNKAVLLPSSKLTLELVADLLLPRPGLKLMVFGHTCDIGSDEYNIWLSQKRADAVKEYLISLGVMGEYIRAKGYGKAHPLAPNDSEENRAANRRVEFVLTHRWWESVW